MSKQVLLVAAVAVLALQAESKTDDVNNLLQSFTQQERQPLSIDIDDLVQSFTTKGSIGTKISFEANESLTRSTPPCTANPLLCAEQGLEFEVPCTANPLLCAMKQQLEAVDPCKVNPRLCPPPKPYPEPCNVDPRLCPPPKPRPDPCKVNPRLCPP